MELLLWTLVLAAVSGTMASIQRIQRAPSGKIHALIVAASSGWHNYRHQADVCHVYHTLRRHGVLPENIIVMMYDDIASNPRNPYPGKIFNRPHGGDVYKGIKIDYKKDSVNPENFLNILRGNASGVTGGSGRVIKSKPNDRIFVYFSDHGDIGMLIFPKDLLTVKQLNGTLNWMHQNDRYSQMVFYIEACYSGSMFENILTNDMNVYAVTAANGKQPSYATHCTNGMRLPCLGDEFTASWTEDSDEKDLTRETLEEQYWLVKEGVNLSQVSKFGDPTIAEKPVGWFQGEEWLFQQKQRSVHENAHEQVSWPAPDVELLYLQQLKDSINDASQAKQIEQRIRKILEDRNHIDTLVLNLVDQLLNDAVDRRRILEEHNPVKDLDCHDEVVRAFDAICIDFNKYDYALKYVTVLNNLCIEIGDSKAIIHAMQTICSDANSTLL